MSEEIRREASPLRRRMIEDMCMRKMQERTQEAYIRGVRRLARFLGRSPEAATAEDLRRFQLHLVKAGVSPITLNATLTAPSGSCSRSPWIGPRSWPRCGRCAWSSGCPSCSAARKWRA